MAFVLTEVIGELYKNLSPASESSTRLCLMFIDAAHQYEAMLDVLLVLGQIDITFLRSGCEELVSELYRFISSCFYFVLGLYWISSFGRPLFTIRFWFLTVKKADNESG